MARYLEQGLLKRNPFETIDPTGVGELVNDGVPSAVARRSPNLKLGVCGEHGGDPESIALFYEAGLDYVSCSPFRVPIARLAAAQAVLGGGRRRGPATSPTWSTVGEPRLSPDGATVAFVVTTVDLEANQYRGRRLGWRPPTGRSRPDPSPRGSTGRAASLVARRAGAGLRLASRGAGKRVVRPAGGRWGRAAPAGVVDRGDRRAGVVTRRSAPGVLGAPARRGALQPHEGQGPGAAPSRPPRLPVRRHGVDLRSPAPAVHGTCRRQPRADTGDGRPVRPRRRGVVARWARTLAFSAGRHETWDLDRALDIFTVDASGGEPRRLTATGPTFRGPSWSPDGSTIAFVWGDPRSLPRSAQVGVVSSGGGVHRLLTTALDRNCAPLLLAAREPVWDGTDLLFPVEDSGNLHVYRVASSGDGTPELVLGGDRWVTGFDAAGGTLAFCTSTATASSELFVLIAWRGATAHRSGSGAVCEPCAGRSRALHGDVTRRRRGGGMDHASVGLRAGSRYPTLLNIHGGPYSQYGYGFFDEFQVQAAAGFGVVYCQPPRLVGLRRGVGPGDQGPEVRPRSRHRLGRRRLRRTCWQCSTRRSTPIPISTASALGVLGGSYGGYMTSWIVGADRSLRGGVLGACRQQHGHDEHTSDIGWCVQHRVRRA